MTRSTKKSAPPSQAALGLRLDEKILHSLDRFYPGSANSVALAAAKSFARGALQKVFVITGKPKSGKSHLLRGVYHRWPASKKEKRFFFDAKDGSGLPAPLLSAGLERPSAGAPVLVCIDNLDLPSGDADKFYEEVFNLFNRLSDSGGCLAVALRPSPAVCAKIPDYLSSRLLTGMVVTLTKPDDEEMKLILDKIGADRSIGLTPKARDYILERSGRSIHDLLELMDRLESSLEPGSRRVGLQLLKRVINWIQP